MNNILYLNDNAIPPKVVNMQHMPVVIVCDTSSSMYGLPIQNVNLCVNRFASDVCKDPLAADIVDVAVIGFNDEPTVIQSFRPISELQHVQFVANGGTRIAPALDLAIKMLRERCHLYDMNGIEIKMPYIILLTDGYGGDVTEIAKIIKKRTEDKKMKLWVLAVKGYDKDTVAKLTEGVRVFELVDENGYDFTDFFDFMAVSIKALSTSAPNQLIHVDNPLEKKDTNLKVPDVNGWINN